MTQVVLVRPWTDGHGGGGCCGGEVRDGVCLDGERVGATTPAVDLVARTWRRLREELPEVDVQLVDAGNTAYLLPATFRAVRRRAGVLAGLRAAVGATAAGAVLVDGDRIGDLEDLGPDGVVAEVLGRLAGAVAD